MKLLLKWLIISLVCSLVIIGLSFYYLENRLEDEIERAILAGYRGTNDVKVELDINWIRGGLKGNIENFKIEIDNWSNNNWKINSFLGNFNNVKVNWWQLYHRRQLVIEKIERGSVQLAISADNLNQALSHYYQGLKIQLNENNMIINFKMNLLGYEFTAVVHGQLKPGQGSTLYFVPKNLILRDTRSRRVLEKFIAKY